MPSTWADKSEKLTNNQTPVSNISGSLLADNKSDFLILFFSVLFEWIRCTD